MTSNPFLEDNIREDMVKAIRTNFLGKICTVLTPHSAIPLKDPIQHSQYYTGELVGVDASGVWVKHPQNGTLAFFLFPLQGIVEEQQISPEDPRYQKIKEEMEKKEKAKTSLVKKPDSAVISVDELSARLRASKNV